VHSFVKKSLMITGFSKQLMPHVPFTGQLCLLKMFPHEKIGCTQDTQDDINKIKFKNLLFVKIVGLFRNETKEKNSWDLANIWTGSYTVL
jgi:hypothetical protein